MCNQTKGYKQVEMKDCLSLTDDYVNFYLFKGGFALSFILYKADIKCMRGKRPTKCGN